MFAPWPGISTAEKESTDQQQQQQPEQQQQQQQSQQQQPPKDTTNPVESIALIESQEQPDRDSDRELEFGPIIPQKDMRSSAVSIFGCLDVTAEPIIIEQPSQQQQQQQQQPAPASLASELNSDTEKESSSDQQTQMIEDDVDEPTAKQQPTDEEHLSNTNQCHSETNRGEPDANMGSDIDHEPGSDSFTTMMEKQHQQPHQESDAAMEFAPLPEQEQHSPADLDDHEEYIVEKILDKRINDKGFAEYFVKWEGYKSTSNSWEPLSHLVDCEKAMQAYELERAKILHDKYGQDGCASAGQAGSKRNEKHSVHEVKEILGITMLEKEKYFLVRLADTEQTSFIRASLANQMFPGKVIDFYVKHVKWRQKSEV